MSIRVKRVSPLITDSLYGDNEKDQIIKKLMDDKQHLLQKYENCKQLNIDLLTKLDKYRAALKRSELESERKAKAIAIYIRNNSESKQNLCEESSDLKSQNDILKNSLKKSQEQIEKLQTDLRFEKKEYQILWQKSVEEKNYLRLEFQKHIDGFKDENEKLVNSNEELINRIDAIRVMNEHIDEQHFQKMKATINEQTHFKGQLIKAHDINESQLKARIDSLTNKYVYLRKQNDLNKREAISGKYRTVASRSLYANAIKKLSKFNIESNEEVFTAIIQIMEKMRSNSNKRIMDKTAKTIIDIKKQARGIINTSERIAQNRSDGKINCGFCDSCFCSKGFLTHHMLNEHSFDFEESKESESEAVN